MKEGLFKNRYRIKSARLKEYDYAEDGYYFVTICTYNRELFFGDIKNGKMILNETGKLVDKYWQEIPTHFGNAILDGYIIMPNHVHGIIIIDNRNGNVADGDNYNVRDNRHVRGRDVALQRLYGRDGKNLQMSEISPKPGSLSTIIRSYKSIVTRESKNINPNFAWQTRFYDHVIFNEKSLFHIREYINNNPLKWELDRNNIENILM